MQERTYPFSTPSMKCHGKQGTIPWLGSPFNTSGHGGPGVEVTIPASYRQSQLEPRSSVVWHFIPSVPHLLAPEAGLTLTSIRSEPRPLKSHHLGSKSISLAAPMTWYGATQEKSHIFLCSLGARIGLCSPASAWSRAVGLELGGPQCK